MPAIEIRKSSGLLGDFTRALLVSALAFTGIQSVAFPPAPFHTIYGVARNEFGQPLEGLDIRVVLEVDIPGGRTLTTPVGFTSIAGANYVLQIPMDTGITGDAYHPTALRPTTPFRLKVLQGGQIFLPMEMSGGFGDIGKPGDRTRIDLTLGVDSDGDGIPDAWEWALIAMLGLDGLDDVDPNGDLDDDGLTNLQEYIAGTYAFDPEDGFALEIIGQREDGPLMEFLAIRGRTYVVHGSDDLKTWTQQTFRVDGETETRNVYRSNDSRKVQIVGQVGEGEKPGRFYLLKIL